MIGSHKKLWEEAEAQLAKANEVLVQLWRETKDKRIEGYFEKECGGICIDGKYHSFK